MNRRAQTNRLLYQARLMLDQAQADESAAFCQAAEDAAIVFMHRAFRASLAEAGEGYGITLQPDAPLSALLERLGQDRPDGWEYRQVTKALREPGHWMRQLQLGAEYWAQLEAPKPRQVAQDQLIQTLTDDDADNTNHYRSWLAGLQKWVDEIRELGDFS